MEKKDKKNKMKKIILGVTGGIACYKACEVVRLLKAEGHDVHVVMTKAAKEFVTPLTFQALSQNKVSDNIFDLTQESDMGHIELGDTADIIAVVPATANFMAKAAHGLCDDLLSTLLLVTKAPILLAPAMNVNMWENVATQDNFKLLKKRSFHFVGPAKGDLACGWQGYGRLEDPATIVKAIQKILK